eukprot:9111866-Alexandrium_andersonii.AAC.1
MAGAVLQASRGAGRDGRPVVAELYVTNRGTCELAAVHEPLGRWDGMLAAVLTAAPAATPAAAGGAKQQQEREAEGGHTEPLFFGTPRGSGLLT